MNTHKLDKERTIRDLVLFVIAINLLSWLGWMVAEDGTVEAIGLGTMIWLGAPLLVSLLIRLFSKDWKDIGLSLRVKGNGRWYAFSLLVFPLVVAVVVLVSILFGGGSLTNFKGGSFLHAMVASFFSFTLAKNIFEEFAWRGYLTPKVDSVVRSPIVGHLLVGLIWGIWHIPYYLALLDKTTLAAYTSQELTVFLPMVILGTTLAGILFGELRLITGSTWPAYLMHMMSNVIITTLLVGGYLDVAEKTEILFTPSWEGIISMVLITLAGLWLYQHRMHRK
ncbi:MAG: CPBP family intramembrane metalloprotease [Anaerolineales bacterium]|nr:CPBP family intramembrane metalloprotease [Anaerolineales bacterium]